jgi:hypothetical protein
LFLSQNIIRVIKSRRMRSVGHVAYMVMMRIKDKNFKILVRISKAKRLLGKPRCRLEDNIKMDLKELGCEGLDWI